MAQSFIFRFTMQRIFIFFSEKKIEKGRKKEARDRTPAVAPLHCFQSRKLVYNTQLLSSGCCRYHPGTFKVAERKPAAPVYILIKFCLFSFPAGRLSESHALPQNGPKQQFQRQIIHFLSSQQNKTKKNRQPCGLTNTVLVAGLVSISLSDSVPLDWLR